MINRLERSTTSRMWAGVCGGIAEYFQVDPTLVRAFFVIAALLTGGLFILVYIALIILMPLPGRPAPGEQRPPSSETPGGETTQSLVAPPADTGSTERRREAAGWLLVALGAIFLLANVGVFRFIEWRYVWPLALIALGIFIVMQRSRQ